MSFGGCGICYVQMLTVNGLPQKSKARLMESQRKMFEEQIIHADATQCWEIRLSTEAAALIFDLRELGLQWRDCLRNMAEDPILWE